MKRRSSQPIGVANGIDFLDNLPNLVIPANAGPATAAFGSGPKIYQPNGLCGNEVGPDGIDTGFGCGDSYAVFNDC